MKCHFGTFLCTDCLQKPKLSQGVLFEHKDLDSGSKTIFIESKFKNFGENLKTEILRKTGQRFV